MATLTKAINKNLFDSILPSFGNPRVHIPVWDDSQKMFICDEFESGNGHRYYRGIRFCDRIVILEKVGLYHNWTYIDSIDSMPSTGRRWNSSRSATTTRYSAMRRLSVRSRSRW